LFVRLFNRLSKLCGADVVFQNCWLAPLHHEADSSVNNSQLNVVISLMGLKLDVCCRRSHVFACVSETTFQLFLLLSCCNLTLNSRCDLSFMFDGTSPDVPNYKRFFLSYFRWQLTSVFAPHFLGCSGTPTWGAKVGMAALSIIPLFGTWNDTKTCSVFRVLRTAEKCDLHSGNGTFRRLVPMRN
jgi:hypothetical protein